MMMNVLAEATMILLQAYDTITREPIDLDNLSRVGLEILSNDLRQWLSDVEQKLNDLEDE